MVRRIFGISIYLMIPFIGVMIYFLFVPRTYKVPSIEKRNSTQYWNLSTGSEIAYTLVQAKGDRKSSPIIFLQGGPGGPIYDSNIQVLSGLANYGYDVYLYDQVGCGQSCRLEKIEEYTVERHKHDLEEIVRMIGAEKVILIGQSWGAILATMFIADNSDKVEKVIFTGPGPILPINTSLDNIRAPDSLNLRNPIFTNKQGSEKVYSFRARIVEICAKAFNMKLASDNEMDDFATVLNYEMGKSTFCDTTKRGPIENGSGYYSMVKTVQSFQDVKDIRNRIKDCSLPVLIMRGQCDGMKWGYVKEYLDLFKNHKLIIIPEAGHSISKEQPELYLRSIMDFIN